MKRIRHWAAVAAIVLLGACEAEQQPQPQPQPKPQNQEIDQPQPAVPQFETRELVISAYSADDSSTKSSRGDDGKFYWSKGDEISVFYGSGTQGGARFTSTITTDRAEQSDFTGTITVAEGETHDEYWAIYPYNPLNEWDDNNHTLTTEVPAHQTAAAGTFADRQFISIGHSTDLSMGFYHLCGGLKFFLREDDDNITKITLRDNKGKAIAGVVDVKVDNENHPYVDGIREPRYEIVLTPPVGQTYFTPNVEYFFVTLPVTFEDGFNLVFERGNAGQVGYRMTAGEMEVHRAMFHWSDNPVDTGVSFASLNSSDISVDIEKEKVRQYLGITTYDNDTQYTNTVIDNYIPKKADGSDQPNPVSLSWTGTASKVLLSKSPSFHESAVTEVSVSSSPAKIYNLIPGTVYYYRVLTSDNSLLKEGCFKPEGPLRMIYLSRLEGNAHADYSSHNNPVLSDNIRDLGGWKAENGKTIRYGRLYRGAHIDNFEGQEFAKENFINLGIGLDMELRGHSSKTDEQNLSKDTAPIPEIDWIQFKVFKLLDVTTNQPGTTSYLYRQAIKKVISYLRDDGRAVYFHCAGGADRTGTLAFLIEALLGVSEADMSKDFELTSFTYKNKRYRTDKDSSHPYKNMILYLRNNFEGNTMQDIVTTWAKTGNDALTDADIELLKALLLE